MVEGHMISLLCDVQAYPPADIIWTKDGQVLEFSTGIHILPGDLQSNSLCVSIMLHEACMHVCIVPSSYLKVVRCCSFPGPGHQDAGQYVCTATNSAGQDQKSILLTVYG